MTGSRNRDDFFADYQGSHTSNYRGNHREYFEEVSSSENAFDCQDGTQVALFNIPKMHGEGDIERLLNNICNEVDGTLLSLRIKPDRKSSNSNFAYATFNSPEVAARVEKMINSNRGPYRHFNNESRPMFLGGPGPGGRDYGGISAKVHIPKSTRVAYRRTNFFDGANQNDYQNPRYNGFQNRCHHTDTQSSMHPNAKGGFKAEIIPESVSLPFFTVVKNSFRQSDFKLESLTQLQLTPQMRNSTCIYLLESEKDEKVIPQLATIRVPNESPFGYSEIELITGEIRKVFNKKLYRAPGNSEIVKCKIYEPEKFNSESDQNLCRSIFNMYLDEKNQNLNGYSCFIIPFDSGEPQMVQLYKKHPENNMSHFTKILEELNFLESDSSSIPLQNESFKFKSPSKVREFVPGESGHSVRRNYPSQSPINLQRAPSIPGVIFKQPANGPLVLQRSASSPSPSKNSPSKPSTDREDLSAVPKTTSSSNSSNSSSEVSSLIFELEEASKIDTQKNETEQNTSRSTAPLKSQKQHAAGQKQEKRVPSPASDNLSVTSSSANSKLSEISLNAPEIVKDSERQVFDENQSVMSGNTQHTAASGCSSVSCSSSPTNIIYNLPWPNPPCETMTVKITRSEGSIFWGQDVDSSVEFWALEKALLNKIEHIRPIGTVKVGSFVTAIYNAKVYRAVYLGDEEKRHRVYFIDYGHIELVDVISLNRPREFWELPAQAIPFKVGDFIPVDFDEVHTNWLCQMYDYIDESEGQICSLTVAHESFSAPEFPRSDSLEMRKLAIAFGDRGNADHAKTLDCVPRAFVDFPYEFNDPFDTEL